MLIHHLRFLTHTASTFPAHSTRLRRWRLKHSEGIVGSTCSRRNLIRREGGWRAFRCWADKNIETCESEYREQPFEGHPHDLLRNNGVRKSSQQANKRASRAPCQTCLDVWGRLLKATRLSPVDEESQSWSSQVGNKNCMRGAVSDERHGALASFCSEAHELLILSTRNLCRQLLQARTQLKSLPSSP